MRGERQLLRLGEYLVDRACRQLPRKARDARYREWVAELPAILHDPDIRFAPRRAVRMLGYAVDALRGAALVNAGSRRRRLERARTAVASLLLVACLALEAWNIWEIARAPGQVLNYLLLGQGLLLIAYSASMLLRSPMRVSALLAASGCLAGAATSLWNAAQHPGDWVNYFTAASLALAVLALWLASRWARTRRSGPKDTGTAVVREP